MKSKNCPTYRLLGKIPLTCLLAVAACSNTVYVPRHLARAELVLRTKAGGLEMLAYTDGKRIQHNQLKVIASTWSSWRKLKDFVHCVPEARSHAEQATLGPNVFNAVGAPAFLLGMSLLAEGMGLGIGIPVYETQRSFSVGFIAGLTALSVVLSSAGATWIAGTRNHMNGHAVDAMNYYNDAVGSLGNSCVN